MFRIHSIQLTQFKNYGSGAFQFDRINGICGLNGIGKTNLLDAIYYCCITKSYFSSQEQFNIGFGLDGFRLVGQFMMKDQYLEVSCVYRNLKKEFALNGDYYEKLSNHVGKLPIVMVAPDDIDLVSGASELRRKFMDSILCQADAAYLEDLIKYNKLLQQRNSLLRSSNPFAQQDVLDIIDQQMAEPGDRIFKKRLLFSEAFNPLVKSFYQKISGGMESIDLQYQSGLTGSGMTELLQQSRLRDLQTGRSHAGIHRDDLLFQLNGEMLKSIASQGQRKSMLFSLKLSEYEILRQQKGFPPLLLLDDVFEKLDDQRMFNLLNWVCKENEGQVFITDTHRDRLEDIFDKLETTGSIIELK